MSMCAEVQLQGCMSKFDFQPQVAVCYKPYPEQGLHCLLEICVNQRETLRILRQ